MKTRIGLLGVLGIWSTMAMIPIAELLPADAYQLLVLRGGSGVVILGLAALFGLRIQIPDRHTMIIAVLFIVACTGLFQAIKAWGANLSAVLLDMAVLVNFVFAIVRGERVSAVNIGVFCAAILGSFLALRGWDVARIQLDGLLWSLLALVANGLFIEYASRAKQSFPTKIFWQSAALVVVGLFGSRTAWSLQAKLPLAVWFGFATGLLNFIFSFQAFSNLKPVWTGTLVLGVTPSILLGSMFITGKTLGYDQILGVYIVLLSVGCLGYQLNKQRTPKLNPAV